MSCTLLLNKSGQDFKNVIVLVIVFEKPVVSFTTTITMTIGSPGVVEKLLMHAFYPFRPRPPPRLRRVGPLRVGRGLNPNAVQLGCNLLKS